GHWFLRIAPTGDHDYPDIAQVIEPIRGVYLDTSGADQRAAFRSDRQQRKSGCSAGCPVHTEDTDRHRRLEHWYSVEDQHSDFADVARHETSGPSFQRRDASSAGSGPLIDLPDAAHRKSGVKIVVIVCRLTRRSPRARSTRWVGPPRTMRVSVHSRYSASFAKHCRNSTRVSEYDPDMA